MLYMYKICHGINLKILGDNLLSPVVSRSNIMNNGLVFFNFWTAPNVGFETGSGIVSISASAPRPISKNMQILFSSVFHKK